MPRPTTIEIGDRFGRLAVEKLLESRDNNGNKLWMCLCDCGAKCIVSTTNLNRAKGKDTGRADA